LPFNSFNINQSGTFGGVSRATVNTFSIEEVLLNPLEAIDDCHEIFRSVDEANHRLIEEEEEG
jgi:hypothetical protein